MKLFGQIVGFPLRLLLAAPLCLFLFIAICVDPDQDLNYIEMGNWILSGK